MSAILFMQIKSVESVSWGGNLKRSEVESEVRVTDGGVALDGGSQNKKVYAGSEVVS